MRKIITYQPDGFCLLLTALKIFNVAKQADREYLVTANFNWQVHHNVLIFSQPNKFGAIGLRLTVNGSRLEQNKLKVNEV